VGDGGRKADGQTDEIISCIASCKAFNTTRPIQQACSFRIDSPEPSLVDNRTFIFDTVCLIVPLEVSTRANAMQYIANTVYGNTMFGVVKFWFSVSVLQYDVMLLLFLKVKVKVKVSV